MTRDNFNLLFKSLVIILTRHPSNAKNNIPIICFAVYLVLAPVMCVLGGIWVSNSLFTYMKYLVTEKTF